MNQPRVFLISPKRGAIALSEEKKRSLVQDHAAKRDLEVVHLRAHELPSLHERSRKIQVLDPWMALDLYEGVHEGPCMVVCIGSPRVMRNHASGHSTGNTWPVSTYVQYKACVVNVSFATTEAQIEEYFDLFATWIAEDHTLNDRDHRILPLHSFDTFNDWVELHTEEGVREFEVSFGKPGSLSDAMGRKWKRAQEQHGRKLLWVAGRAIPPGSHWDVQAHESSTKLFTPHQIWSIPPQSYLNVYPDGFVRRAQSSATPAKLLKEAAKPNEILDREADKLREKQAKKKPRRGRANTERKRPGRRR
jgi:hypothetical protein